MSTAATTSSSRSSTRPAIIAILAISAAATLFLFWLIYEHPAADTSRTQLAFLPALNALLNGLSATALLIGFTFIRARRIAAHRASMITAFAFSTLFLAKLHPPPLSARRRPISRSRALRSLYLPLLASHIILATLALPLILVTFFFSLSGRFPQHRKVARWTFPMWLYVSVTGVITYAMLRLAQGQ